MLPTGMEGRAAVQGVLLDASLLFRECPSGGEQIAPEVERFLYRFCFSNLHMGVLFSINRGELLAERESLLRAVVPWYALHIQHLDYSHTCHTLTEVTSAWNIPAKSCIFLTDQYNEDFRSELLCQGWLICLVSDNANSNIRDNELSIKGLHDLPSQIAKLNKEVLHDKVLIIGYTMKWSREKDFLRRHAFPFYPTESWLSFFPINLELSLQQQLASVDLILQKPTDEITCIIPDVSGKFMGHIKFSEGMERLSRYLQEHPHICVVDPLERILPLLDRDAIQTILQGLSEVTVPGHPRVRSPHFLKVPNFDDPGLFDALDSAKVALPTIVKPQLACGLFDAHTMAVVFRNEGYSDLDLPLPCVIQEYIDHGSIQYKFYVVGREIFYSVRKSTPNAIMMANPTKYSRDLPPAITFHSLKSLPLQFGAANTVSGEIPPSAIDRKELDLGLIHNAAMWLREKINLTIFGFDVVIQDVTLDHVIVDVNYFSSFKEIQDEKAIPAFWKALQTASSMHHEARYATRI